jgi:hypothetical protein
MRFARPLRFSGTWMSNSTRRERRYGLLWQALLATLGTAIILPLLSDVAEARKRRHYGYHQAYFFGLPADLSRGRASHRVRRSDRERRSEAVGPRLGKNGSLVLPGWQTQPADPNSQGKRFISPDGTAWLAVYSTPPSSKDNIQADLRSVIFADGERITYLRGEHDWVAVSGLKGDRIFYRKARLACGGQAWHHIAFDYPADRKRSLDPIVKRASDVLDRSENDGCSAAVSSAQ